MSMIYHMDVAILLQFDYDDGRGLNVTSCGLRDGREADTVNEEVEAETF